MYAAHLHLPPRSLTILTAVPTLVHAVSFRGNSTQVGHVSPDANHFGSSGLAQMNEMTNAVRVETACIQKVSFQFLNGYRSGTEKIYTFRPLSGSESKVLWQKKFISVLSAKIKLNFLHELANFNWSKPRVSLSYWTHTIFCTARQSKVFSRQWHPTPVLRKYSMSQWDPLEMVQNCIGPGNRKSDK